jgi:glutathione S-transferase
MSIKLYELTGDDDDRQFSPYCWRIRMALAHKGLAVTTVPWRFTEGDALKFAGATTVPVMVDGDKTVKDSWDIALYLDEAYPDRPKLFDSKQSAAVTLFFKQWAERSLPVMPVVVMDLFGHLHAKDKDYFRTTREKRFGKTLEEVGGNRAGATTTFRAALEPARQVLAVQPFICGATPGFADYIFFGPFMFARSMSPAQLLATDDPVHAWRERMLDLHGGIARKAKGYPV